MVKGVFNGEIQQRNSEAPSPSDPNGIDGKAITTRTSFNTRNSSTSV
jgi:hypothetical protein